MMLCLGVGGVNSRPSPIRVVSVISANERNLNERGLARHARLKSGM